jgi:hypothetical protein
MKLGREWAAIDDLTSDLRQTASLLLAHRNVRLTIAPASTGAELLTDALAVRGILRALLIHATRGQLGGEVTLRITSNHYSVRFVFETRDAGSDDGAEPAGTISTFLTLPQARRLAQILDGDVVVLHGGAERSLSLALPRTDATGRPLLRSAGRGRLVRGPWQAATALASAPLRRSDERSNHDSFDALPSGRRATISLARPPLAMVSPPASSTTGDAHDPPPMPAGRPRWQPTLKRPPYDPGRRSRRAAASKSYACAIQALRKLSEDDVTRAQDGDRVNEGGVE